MRSLFQQYFVFLLTLLFNMAAFAQGGKLIGNVVDARSGDALTGANVYLMVSQTGTTTDEDGVFILTVSEAIIESDTLAVSFVGYQLYRQALSSFKNKSKIKLRPLTIQQDSVSVLAERIDIVKQEIPHARSVVTFEEIEARGSSEISDLLKGVPSVRVEGNDVSGRQIQIRGSNAGEVNVYIDGILINSLGLDNAADLSIISTESIEALEILKGANLTLLGNGAFGGVVNVKTKKNLNRSALVKTKQGSFATQYYIGEVNLPISRNAVFKYFAQFNSVEPGIEYFPSEAQDSSKTENDAVTTEKHNHNLTFNYYSKKGEFSARAYGYLLDYEKLAIDNSPLSNERINLLFSSGYTGSLLGINDFDFRVNYLLGGDELRRDRIQGEGVADRFTDNFDFNRMNIKLLKKYPIQTGNEIQILAEYFHDELEIDVAQVLGGVERSVYNALLYENRWSIAGVAAFSNQLGKSPNKLWKTHLGMRGDIIATGDKYLSPTTGFQLEFKQPKWTLAPYGNYGKNIKVQTLLDNAYDAIQEITGDDSVLTRLKPEESNAGEVGIEYRRHGEFDDEDVMFIKLSVFRNTVFNKLVTLPNFGGETLVLRQLGRNVTQGFETSIGFNSVAPGLDFVLSATVLNVEQLALYPFKPENMFSLQSNYSSRWGGYFSTTFFYEGRSKALVENREGTGVLEDDIEPFFDIDFSVGYRFKLSGAALNLQVAGFNVLDNSGFQFYLLKKQFFQASLSAKF